MPCKKPEQVWNVTLILMRSDKALETRKGGVRCTVVARWTAGQHVERSILRQGHDS